MDIGTVLGITAGWVLVFVAIAQGGDIATFIDVPSMLIVAGGTMAATLVHFPLSEVLGVLGVVKNAFFHKSVSGPEMIAQIVRFADKARREGMLALEAEANNVSDPFLKKGLMLAVDGTAPEVIREVLTIELEGLEERHARGQQILKFAGSASPAFGMIGTLIGLIIMLQNLSDPSSIGTGMAVALVTTLYGALAANIIFIPVAGKLEKRGEAEMLVRRLIMEGIMSIQSGDNPRIVEEKLKSFLAPKVRAQVQRERSSAAARA